MKQKKVIPSHRCLRCYKMFPTAFAYSLHVQRKHFRNKIKTEGDDACLAAHEYVADVKVEDPKIEEIVFPEIKIEIDEEENVVNAKKRCFTRKKNQNRKYKKLNWIKCKFCGRGKRICFYEHHVVIAHKPCTCCLCHQTVFSLKHAFKISAKNNIINYKCCYCDETFTFISLLNKHLAAHSKEKIYACTICDYKFVSYEALEEHCKRHNLFESILRGEYCCNFCNKQFKHKCNFDVHKAENHVAMAMWCMFCNKQFRDKIHFQAHITGVHETKPKYACDYCNETFKRKDALAKHISVQHTKTKRSKGLRSIDRRFKHDEYTPDDLKCRACDKQYKYKKSFDIHNTTLHSRENVRSSSVSCQICGKQFAHRKNLGNHLYKVHTCNRPNYVCSLCKKGYKRKISLYEHLESLHSRATAVRVACGICSRRFKNKLCLRYHNSKMHLGRQRNT